MYLCDVLERCRCSRPAGPTNSCLIDGGAPSDMLAEFRPSLAFTDRLPQLRRDWAFRVFQLPFATAVIDSKSAFRAAGSRHIRHHSFASTSHTLTELLTIWSPTLAFQR